MSQVIEDKLAALKAARIAVHEMEIQVHLGQIAELRLDEPDADLSALSHAICLAARDLYLAVEALPVQYQPKGWRQQ